MIDLEPHSRGTILPVRARAAARRSGVDGVHDGMLKVSVTAAPEKGKANKAIIAVLAETLRLPKSQIELLSGSTSPQKRFLITGMEVADLGSRLSAVLNRAS